MILSDGVIGQMMEKVVLPPYKPRRTEEQIKKECPWATIGRTHGRQPNILTSLELKPEVMGSTQSQLQDKYNQIKENECVWKHSRWMMPNMIVSFGSAAPFQKALEIAREEGMKVGLFCPITLWPFPSKQIAEMACKRQEGHLGGRNQCRSDDRRCTPRC